MIVSFGGCASGAGTLYIDNIRLVTAEETAYDCDPMPTKMDVDYTYGRLSIGGGGFVSGLMSDATPLASNMRVPTWVEPTNGMPPTALGNSCSIL
jgi:hypothetical protein